MMKRKSKQSITLLDVVEVQHKVIGQLKQYVQFLEQELAIVDVARQVNTDERIKEITTSIRRAGLTDKSGKLLAQPPERTADQIVGDLDVIHEITKRKYEHYKRPSVL